MKNKFFILFIILLSMCLLTGCNNSNNNDTEEILIVIFDSNGGSEISDQKVLKGEKIIEPKDPIKSGSIFLGWYNENNKWNFEDVLTKSLTLKAKWGDNGDKQKLIDYFYVNGTYDSKFTRYVVELNYVNPLEVFYYDTTYNKFGLLLIIDKQIFSFHILITFDGINKVGHVDYHINNVNNFDLDYYHVIYDVIMSGTKMDKLFNYHELLNSFNEIDTDEVEYLGGYYYSMLYNDYFYYLNKHNLPILY